MLRLDGKRALVTGGASGIGRATVELLARRGARVITTDLNADALAGLPHQVIAVEADVRDHNAMAAVVDRAASELGGLDILVNNAGIEIVKPFVDHDEDDLARLFDTNVLAVFAVTRLVVPLMREAGGGAIVNLSSIAGERGSGMFSGYSATKGAILRLTESLSRELRPDGIRVNAVCPGFIDTPMVTRLAEILAPVLPMPADEAIAAKQGRLGTAAEVAEVILFLAGDDASLMSGSHVAVDLAANQGAL